MSTNHLIIGLGGTGGKIIRAFRKTLFQEFRGRRLEKVNLGKGILSEVEAFKTNECNGDTADPRYETILTAGKTAMKLTAAPV